MLSITRFRIIVAVGAAAAVLASSGAASAGLPVHQPATAPTAGASPLTAGVTQSNVTTPSDGSFVRYDENNRLIGVKGTSNGTNSDKVDLYCTSGSGASFASSQIATNVPVAADGSFSYAGSAGSADRQACVIRAVPAGTTLSQTSNLTMFTGPRVYLGEVGDSRVLSGPNAGTLYDYYLYNSQAQGGMDYDSLGSCGLDDSYVYDPMTLAQSHTLFYCNAYLWARNGNSANSSRSELQIDGRNAYPPGAIRSTTFFTGVQDNPGFLGITFNVSFARSTGDMTIDETDPFLFCPGNPYPPTATNCASFERAPIDFHRTITMNHLGRVVTITDSFSSRDHAAHRLDLLYEQDFEAAQGGDPAYLFPWRETAYNQHALLDTFAGPGGSAPGSIFVKASKSAPDGDPNYPQGAISYSSPPDDIQFLNYPSTTLYNYANASWALHYKRTVPASGPLTLSFVYSQAFLAADVAQLAHAAEQSLTQPPPVVTGGTPGPTPTSTAPTSTAPTSGCVTQPGPGKTQAVRLCATPTPSCHTVTKRVHGKKKIVRVCTSPKRKCHTIKRRVNGRVRTTRVCTKRPRP